MRVSRCCRSLCWLMDSSPLWNWFPTALSQILHKKVNTNKEVNTSAGNLSAFSLAAQTQRHRDRCGSASEMTTNLSARSFNVCVLRWLASKFPLLLLSATRITACASWGILERRVTAINSPYNDWLTFKIDSKIELWNFRKNHVCFPENIEFLWYNSSVCRWRCLCKF